jgi:CBS domain-containing protein
MSTRIIDEVADFLARVPAFRLLDRAEVRELASRVEIDFSPAGAAILAEGDPPSEFLKIVVSGGVKVSLTSGDGDEVDVDYRSEGAAIGYISLFSGERSRVNVAAVEDTLCYLIPRKHFLEMLERRPDVREFFTRTFITTYMDKLFSDLRDGSLARGGRTQPMFSTPVGDLIKRKAITAPPQVSIRDAARIMSRHRVSSLVISSSDHARRHRHRPRPSRQGCGRGLRQRGAR